MITEKRHQLILSELKEKGSVKVADLVEKFNFSESTIRRDLVQLEARHCLKRVHGGAIPVLNKFVEKSYQDKKSQFIHQKDGMAKYAASFVQDGESIYLDSGTTTFEMIKYLKENGQYVVYGMATEEDKVERSGTILDIQKEYFVKIVEHCASNGIELYVVMPPVRDAELVSYSKEEMDSFHFMIKEVLGERFGGNYLNCSDLIEFKHYSNYTDITHLNVRAADRFSEYLNDVLDLKD